MTLRKKARWALHMEKYRYIIVHRPGSSMNHVDALNRIERIPFIGNQNIESDFLKQPTNMASELYVRGRCVSGHLVAAKNNLTCIFGTFVSNASTSISVVLKKLRLKILNCEME